MPTSLSAIITLLTDFGLQDYFVGAMKGVILAINPSARIIDITHEIPPQDIEAGAFNLLACYRDFPQGTIHVAVVDPGVGSTRRPILIASANQFFIGPDNGIFSWICEREGKYKPIHLHNEKFFRQPVSSTFHGRDIFAPVAGALSVGTPFDEFGTALADIIRLDSLEPKSLNANEIEARIIHIDRFGNCITNLNRADLGVDFDGTKLRVGNHEITSFRNYFSEEAEQNDEIFCIVGSAGFVEIVAKNRSAAEILAAERGQSAILVRS